MTTESRPMKVSDPYPPALPPGQGREGDLVVGDALVVCAMLQRAPADEQPARADAMARARADLGRGVGEG